MLIKKFKLVANNFSYFSSNKAINNNIPVHREQGEYKYIATSQQMHCSDSLLVSYSSYMF
jgi:hypothetical protein